jgi:thiamine-monophosphate kinase
VLPAVSDLTERDLIARIRQRVPTTTPPWLVVGMGDDGAVVEGERNHLQVLTVDAVVEGVHFDRALTPPEAIGHRALAVNLSDLAAMGARPRLALLSMAVPPALPLSDFDAIVAGFATLADRYHVQLVGGNLTRSPGPLMLDVTAMGVARRRHVLRRQGARAGDEVFLTGTIGGAKAALQRLRAGGEVEPGPDPKLAATTRRYLFPEARVRAGVLVAKNRAASACMDVSDGLADAVTQVADASGVGMTLDAAALPIDPGAREWFAAQGLDPVWEAMSDSDDYELLFTVPRRTRRSFFAAATLSGTLVTRIGVCTPALGVRVDGHPEGRALPAGFSHFR